MSQPQYVDLDGARETLAQMGISLSERQMKRAAETDADGNRKLPFFVDPIEKKLKIERGTLVQIYCRLQADAENSAEYKPVH